MEQVCDCGNVKSRFEPYCYICTFKTDYVTGDYQDWDHDYPEPMSVGWSEDSDLGNSGSEDYSSEPNQPTDISLPYEYGNNRLLESPEFFIGNTENTLVTKRLIDADQFYFDKIQYNEGAENIFKDLLDFVSNNTKPSSKIKVYFNTNVIMFKFKPRCHVDLKLFEIMDHDKSNLDIIIANIFSSRFTVKICDCDNRETNNYQSWFDNMKYSDGPERITVPEKSKDWMTIGYELDWTRFSIDEYSSDMIRLLSSHLVDLAFTNKIPVKILDRVNNVQMSFNDMGIEDYTEAYNISSYDIRFQNKEVELMVSWVPNNGYHVSFVNGIYTEDGGAHVAKVYKTIRRQFRDCGFDVSIDYLKNNLVVIMSCWVNNPCFNNQIKSTFHSPVPDFNLDVSYLVERIRKNTIQEDDCPENYNYCVIF